jgi:8-oxo-dGTP pyrophosphatase MutT (NUDIX family)
MNDLATKLLARLQATDGGHSHPNVRPRDAATMIIVDRAGPKPKVLLGRRHHGHTFMPGKFVFPGGRVELTDRRMDAASALDPRVEARLMRRMPHPSPLKARGLVLAAIRETFEETGLLLGSKGGAKAAAGTVPAGPWEAFALHDIIPDLATVHFVARALTPPRRPKRFDTRFFAVDATAIGARIEGVVGPDTELVELVWLPIDEAQQLDMPAITTAVLEELEARSAAGFSHDLPVPFYGMVRGRRTRELL